MKPFDSLLKSALFKRSFVRRASYLYQRRRVRTLLPRIETPLRAYRCSTVLDLGPNTCVLAEMLAEQGFDVTGLDIADWSLSQHLKPLIYDGVHFPFEDKRFDFGLALSMLHHTTNQAQLLLELRRTCRFILIQEDLLTSWPRNCWLFLLDSLSNLQLTGHPRSYRRDLEWRTLFNSLRLDILGASYYKWGLVQFGVYLLRGQ